ncbi:VWA domain-containing protein [Devosia sp. BSSL-BM10]|uniref:VWA domain-containing protein n=1 Tax=Devosia litorisediminis TaxID=2829817 RepID=A0A942E7M1_9HYPH|nr:VWA domain-containing protein [Devosia litorisediminis]MBS3847304.1 VWA domain-containing protein [Devosia litorisediminis]
MSNEHPNDPFEQLRGATAPTPDADARQKALAAGMAAFAGAQEKSNAPTQGMDWGQRLTAIITSLKGKSIMDLRIPIGTAAIALLVLPLGYQLYSSTSLTPSAPAAQRNVAPLAPSEIKEALAVAEPAPVLSDQLMSTADAPQPAAASKAAPMGQIARNTVPMVMAESDAIGGAMPAPSLAMAPADPSGDVFSDFDEQRLQVVADAPVSTFSVDVDTASYAYVRRMLEDGLLPEPDAVRIEELLNYFPYDYAPASSAAVPFQPSVVVYPTPWNPDTQLLQIGIKGYVPPTEADTPSNLVFLIDTSGSMNAPDKLPLLKRAFGLLVEQLDARDSVSIVVYAGSAGVVLEPTAASEKAKILAALDDLAAGGGTAGAAGISLAYQLAEQAKVEGGTNRVILATDGDFNVGIDDPDALEDFIKTQRDGGVTLSVLGFGRGNLDDATMQALAQNGNGNASYISSFREAQKVLVEEGGSTLDMIAKDVKVQVEFNPASVAEYRLIGYETRALNREDFNNDAVDAGDVGAGHNVTALYEITPVGSPGALVDPLRYGSDAQAGDAEGEIAFLKMRYKLPDSDVSQLIEQPVTADLAYGDIADAGVDQKFAAAVAAFGQKLKGSDYGQALGWDDIAALAQAGRGADESGYRAEFIQLVRTAALLKPDTAAACRATAETACE